MVTLTFKKMYILLAECCSLLIPEQAVIIPLYGTGWLAFVTPIACTDWISEYDWGQSYYLNSVHVGFVVDNATLRQVFFPSTSVFSYQYNSYSILIFVCTLLLPEGQTGDA